MCVLTLRLLCSVETLKLVSPIKKSKAPNERWPKVPRIEYPEDRLVQSYYARHPEVRSLHLCHPSWMMRLGSVCGPKDHAHLRERLRDIGRKYCAEVLTMAHSAPCYPMTLSLAAYSHQWHRQESFAGCSCQHALRVCRPEIIL